MIGSIRISGLGSLEGKLEKLVELAGEKRGEASIRYALSRAAGVIARRARANARALDRPETPNKIYLNVRSQRMKYAKQRGADIGYRIGVLGGARDMKKYGEFTGDGKQNPGGDTWYWRFLEYGIPSRNIKPRPLLRDAAEKGSEDAIETFSKELEKAINKALSEVT